MDKQSLIFSANNLQTYVDCARRFELSYLEGLVWPAVEREPVLKSEEFLENGRIFHEMVHRDILGIPVPAVDPLLQPDIARWWKNYQISVPAKVEGVKYPEKTLVGEILGHILVATYDLIVISETGQARIYDWKTWRHPERVKDIDKRLQSRIYPLLLAQAAHTLSPSLQLAPAQIEMYYWLAERPAEPAVIKYSETALQDDHRYLEDLVNEILELESGDFALTEDVKKCNYCPYRSFCDRGDVAGNYESEEILDEADMAVELLGDLDDYESVAF